MKNLFAVLCCFLFSQAIAAKVLLPSVISDGMVLQRNAAARIWGWSNPDEVITVRTEWDNHEYKVTGNGMAMWEIRVRTPQAGGPYTILIKGENTILLQNILIGEVWLCSGQSNMEMPPVWGILKEEEEIRNANYPAIRLFTVNKMTAETPQVNVPGNWVSCSPETMKTFSATAYFFAQQLQNQLHIPIGLINSSWGGTPAEFWIPAEAFADNPAILEAAQNLNPPGYWSDHSGKAFNAMIAPLKKLTIAGVIWYQGEANVGSDVYDQTFAALITNWRKYWEIDFPFYYVQIAPYKYNQDNVGAIIRNAQRKTLQLVPNTAMALTGDTGSEDIHPKDKKSVGVRLANLALSGIYKKDVGIVNGPLFKKATVHGHIAAVYFDYGDGLHFKHKKSTQFEIAGADGQFYTARALIQNDVIFLSSGKVKNPKKVRYLWMNDAEADLFNNANLPASTFLSDAE